MLFGPKFSTIVFSDTSIKLAVAKSVSNRFKVSFIAKKTLPPQTVFNGRITNANLFSEALKTLFLENFDRIKTKNVIVGLNEPETFLTSIKFEDKPKHLEKEINEKIVPILPFNLGQASLLYTETSPRTYQVAAARTEELRLISDIFESAGFSVKALVPLPLIFQKLLGKKEFPHLFLSSEEDLIYSLIVNDATVFSSSFRPKNPLAESEKEVIKFAGEIIENEYKEGATEQVKQVYIHGRGTEFLKSFFKNRGFNTEIVFASDKTSGRTGYDIGEFGRVITLSLYDSSVLSFPKINVSRDVQISSQVAEKSRLKPIYLFLPLLAIAAITVFIFWPNLKDIFLSRFADQGVTSSQKQTTAAASPQKEASPSAEKKETTVSPKPKTSINKNDFTIQVLNGSGKIGVAGVAKDFLISKGYNVANTGNADHFNYQKTTVQIKTSKKAISDLLTKDLKERYSIDIGSPLAEDEQFDILIIIGGE